MNEPEQLKRGRAFQKIVQKDYKDNSKGGGVRIETQEIKEQPKSRIAGF